MHVSIATFGYVLCYIGYILKTLGTSLAVQRLRFHAPNAGGTGSVFGPGTKILHAAWHGRVNKVNNLKINK